MTKVMRETTLETIGLGKVIDIFREGRLPVGPGEAVDRVFGDATERGSMVISGASGIVGAGKTMQLGSRLAPYGVKIVALDFPGAPDGIGQQYQGLARAFGREGADAIMRNIIRLNYDGRSLPDELAGFRPRFLLEAIPEILELKRAHYKVFRDTFPEIEIRSVTSGFPASELGVGVAHPAFPHEINKIWEVVEDEPSAITQLLWALGLTPVAVSDNWSFVLDVLFCGVTLAASRYGTASNMPAWKVDKFTRKLVGPNPLRAHDAIGTKGATFLTWSCLHHLAEMYGPLFQPTAEIEERKETGQSWYPPNHFRPLVDWSMDREQAEEFESWILGPLFQMTSLMLHEQRGHLTHINAIGELCAQFRRGILAVIRDAGSERVIGRVEAYHRLHPAAREAAWHPEVFEAIGGADWQQLYVNAEHDGSVGVVTISRESMNDDVDRELNRAFDWLRAEGIENLILTGDFHLSTQMVGADTSAIYPALESVDEGVRLTKAWSSTARRLDSDFATAVGFIGGKRCLGGMLELMVHCVHLVAADDARFGFPEVTLPIVPGVEGCHWTIRKSPPADRPKVLRMLLTGQEVKARDAVGWLIDHAGPIDGALQVAWNLANGRSEGIAKRELERGAFDLAIEAGELPEADSPATETARAAIAACARDACGTDLGEALDVQCRHAAEFIASKSCRKGVIGTDYTKTMKI